MNTTPKFLRRPVVTRSRTILASIIIACAGLMTGSASAQEILTGTVTNSATGQNLEGARVVLKGTAREAVTDSQGVYRFDNVPAGNAVLVVSYTGLDAVD